MDAKPTSPWIAATACCALVIVAGIGGIAAMRTQMMVHINAENARTRGTLTQLQNRIAALESQTSTLAQTVEQNPAPLNALKTGIETNDKSIADLTARIDTLEKKPALVVTAAPAPTPAAVPATTAPANGYATLAAAVRSGTPYVDVLAAWKSNHTAAPETLAPIEKAAATGLATDYALRTQLQTTLARLSTTGDIGEPHSLMARVNTHLSGLVSIRKQSAASGYENLRTHAATEEIAALKREIEQLSPTDRAPLTAWLDAVRTRDETLAALVSLADAKQTGGTP